MKFKKEYILLAVVIVVLVLYLALHQTDRTHYQLPVLSDVPAAGITRIEIGVSDQALELNKKADQWYVGIKEYPADSAKVKEMLDVLDDLTVTALVSESGNYIRYDLNDDKKITVKAWSGSTLSRNFFIGKSAPTFQHTHVLLDKDANVYHARGNFRDKFDQTVDDLRDLTVLSFDPEEILEIEITRDKAPVVIRRQAVASAADEKNAAETVEKTESVQTGKPIMTWQTADGDVVDDAAVKALLSSLSRLKCDKYIKESEKGDFKNPVMRLTIKGKKAYRLEVFGKTDKESFGTPAFSSENKDPFLLPDGQVSGIRSKIEALQPEADKK